MIFLAVVTKLDRLSMYFSLFHIEAYLRKRMISVFCFSPATENTLLKKGMKTTQLELILTHFL